MVETAEMQPVAAAAVAAGSRDPAETEDIPAAVAAEDTAQTVPVETARSIPHLPAKTEDMLPEAEEVEAQEAVPRPVAMAAAASLFSPIHRQSFTRRIL